MTDTEDPLVRSARREALIVLGVWLGVLCYTLGVAARWGYGRPLDDLTFVCGFPDWVFWGIVVPWVGCFVFSTWFALCYMSDVPLDADGSSAAGNEEPANG